MKALKTLPAALLIAAFAIPALNGCKKGEEDPGISFKSRNARVTGTWTLKSFEMSWTKSGTKKITNDENDDDWNETSSSSGGTTYDGSSLSVKYSERRDYVSQYKWYDTPNTQWKDQELTWAQDSMRNYTQVYEFSIALYTDNTYEITETYGNVNGSYDWSWDRDWDDSNDPAAVPNDNADDNDSWNTIESITTVDQGSWYWDEWTKKKKLYLNAGPISGKVTRLSSKEMKVEIQYSWLGGQSETTSDVGSRTDILVDWPLLTYNNTNPTETNDGDITTITTNNDTETEVMWVFEKTDKNSKRHKATGSTE